MLLERVKVELLQLKITKYCKLAPSKSTSISIVTIFQKFCVVVNNSTSKAFQQSIINNI